MTSRMSYDLGVKTKNMQYSDGYEQLLAIRDSPDMHKYQVGSMMYFQSLATELIQKIDSFSLYNVEPSDIYSFGKWMKQIKDYSLPEMMKPRIWTEISQLYYSKLRIAISTLLDDLQTWWRLNLNDDLS